VIILTRVTNPLWVRPPIYLSDLISKITIKVFRWDP
jgi:hypothetical protein